MTNHLPGASLSLRETRHARVGDRSWKKPPQKRTPKGYETGSTDASAHAASHCAECRAAQAEPSGNWPSGPGADRTWFSVPAVRVRVLSDRFGRRALHVPGLKSRGDGVRLLGPRRGGQDPALVRILGHAGSPPDAGGEVFGREVVRDPAAVRELLADGHSRGRMTGPEPAGEPGDVLPLFKRSREEARRRAGELPGGSTWRPAAEPAGPTYPAACRLRWTSPPSADPAAGAVSSTSRPRA